MVSTRDTAQGRALSQGLGAVLEKWLPLGADVNAQQTQALWQDLASGGWLELLTIGLSDDPELSSDATITAAEQLGVYLAPPAALLACGFLVPLLGGLAQHWPPARDLRSRLDQGDIVAVPVPRVIADPAGYAFAERVRCEPGDDGLRLIGSVARYLDLESATTALVPVALRDGGTGLALIRLDHTEVSVSSRETVVPGVQVCELNLDRALIEGGQLLTVAVDDVVRRAGAQWSLALDCHAVGIAAAILDRTVDYAKKREQFGQAIGAFQAVQHTIADMHVLLETSRSLLTTSARQYQGCREISPALAADIFASRLHSSETARRVCESAIQVHGGAGFTWEFGLHYWYRAAMFARQFCTDGRGIRVALAGSLRETARRREERRSRARVGGMS